MGTRHSRHPVIPYLPDGNVTDTRALIAVGVTPYGGPRRVLGDRRPGRWGRVVIGTTRLAITAAAVVACVVCSLSTPGLSAQDLVELPAEDRILSAGFEELYQVGSLLEAEWDTFGQIAAVAFDAAGNLYILDTQAARLSVVDLQGNPVRQFGRLGEGPGEFSEGGANALTFTVCSDERIVVYDPGRRVFMSFGSDGQFERGIPLEGPTFISIPGLQADHVSLSVVATGEVQYLDWTPLPRPSFRHVMRYTLGGEEVAVDTVAAGWKPPGDREAFAPVFRVGVLPDGGVAFTDSSAYAIKVTRPDGGLSRILTRPFRPLLVTGQVKAEYLERELKALEHTTMAWADFRRAELESMEFYHEIPVVRDLRTSREGTIWVGRSGDQLDSDGPIDLIAADGRYLGSYAPGATGLPSAFGPDGLVAFVERNDLDVPTVVVKRLPRGVR